jgi:hypothetical protein
VAASQAIPTFSAALFEMTDAQWEDGLALKLHGARRLTIRALDALKAAAPIPHRRIVNPLALKGPIILENCKNKRAHIASIQRDHDHS